MSMSSFQFFVMIFTVTVVIGAGLYAARSVQSAEGYSLGGRSATATLVAGSIAGTVVGGGATVGTAQLAYTMGLSAWWFTLGSGISFIIMGIFYARPLRMTGLETIPQYLSANYGEKAGKIASVLSSVGMFFAAVSSSLPAIKIISVLFGISVYAAAALQAILVLAYVFFGGMKTAGVGGILKMAVIWASLFFAGFSAFWLLHTDAAISTALPDFPWYSLVGAGTANAAANLFSLIVGIICTQTYIQAIFSASNPRTASVGALVAALIVIPVGLPSAFIGIYMHITQPDIAPILVLPTYLLQQVPEWLGGIAMGGIMLSLISSLGGMSLGMGTILSRDVISPFFKISEGNKQLLVTRAAVVAIMVIAIIFSIIYLDSQILMWNYLSMALRGCGIFLPLTIALFRPKCIHPAWAIVSMIMSVLAAVCATVIGSAIKPLFIGLAVSLVILIPGYFLQRRRA